nr:2OG-Fe dioxygenase family protein [Pigmentibacter ruber]
MKKFYKLKKINNISQELTLSFQKLPLDSYTKANYDFRKRRFSIGKFNYNKVIHWYTNNVFFQSLETNSYNGNLNRNFENIDDNVLKEIETQILPNIICELPLSEYQVGIHQIRVFSEDNTLGLVAPEGIHQDGFKFLAICCIAKKNISGAITQIIDQDKITIVYEKALNPFDLIIFNDEIFYHYTSSFKSKNNKIESYRDVFVFTFK